MRKTIDVPVTSQRLPIEGTTSKTLIDRKWIQGKIEELVNAYTTITIQKDRIEYLESQLEKSGIVIEVKSR